MVPELASIGARVFFCVLCFCNWFTYIWSLDSNIKSYLASVVVMGWRRKKNSAKLVHQCNVFIGQSLFFLAPIVVVGWWYFAQSDWTLRLYPIWPQLWWWTGGGKRVVETMTSQLGNVVLAIRDLTVIPKQSPQKEQK